MVEGSFTFFLAPQAAPDETSQRDAIDFVCLMVILNQGQKPVLVADIKNDKWADSADKRWIADIHTRQRYDQMLAECPIPELYGLSLLGPSLRVYRGVKATGVVVLSLSTAPIWIVLCHLTSWRGCGI